MTQKTYTALTTITHDGERYGVGAIEAPAQKSRPAAGTKAE